MFQKRNQDKSLGLINSQHLLFHILFGVDLLHKTKDNNADSLY